MSTQKTPAIFTPEYSRVARAFIDFVNVQVGAYMDACSGFAKNKSVVERQVHRDVRRTAPGGAQKTLLRRDLPWKTLTTDVLMHRIVLFRSISPPTQLVDRMSSSTREPLLPSLCVWDEEVRRTSSHSRRAQMRLRRHLWRFATHSPCGFA